MVETSCGVCQNIFDEISWDGQEFYLHEETLVDVENPRIRQCTTRPDLHYQLNHGHHPRRMNLIKQKIQHSFFKFFKKQTISERISCPLLPSMQHMAETLTVSCHIIAALLAPSTVISSASAWPAPLPALFKVPTTLWLLYLYYLFN